MLTALVSPSKLREDAHMHQMQEPAVRRAMSPDSVDTEVKKVKKMNVRLTRINNDLERQLRTENGWREAAAKRAEDAELLAARAQERCERAEMQRAELEAKADAAILAHEVRAAAAISAHEAKATAAISALESEASAAISAHKAQAMEQQGALLKAAEERCAELMECITLHEEKQTKLHQEKQKLESALEGLKAQARMQNDVRKYREQELEHLKERNTELSKEVQKWKGVMTGGNKENTTPQFRASFG